MKHFQITHAKTGGKIFDKVLRQMIAPQTNVSSFPRTESNHFSLFLTLSALFKRGHCQHAAQLMLHRASGASQRNTLSSCGTHREALMPCCHCQYIWTVMMFPQKYFMLYAASKTGSRCMNGRGNLRSITLKGSQRKVNERRSPDAPCHEG